MEKWRGTESTPGIVFGEVCEALRVGEKDGFGKSGRPRRVNDPGYFFPFLCRIVVSSKLWGGHVTVI